MPKTRKRKSRSTQKKISVKALLRSRAVLVFVVFGIIVIGISLTKQIIRKVEINQQITGLEEEIALLDEQNADLNGLLDYFNSSSFQEKEARKKLGLKDESETVVMLPDTSIVPDAGGIEVVAEQPEEVVSNPKKWHRYFFN